MQHRFSEEVANLHAECDSKAMQDIDADVAPPALDAADVGRVDICTLGEGLLRPLPLGSEFADTCPEVVPPRLGRG